MALTSSANVSSFTSFLPNLKNQTSIIHSFYFYSSSSSPLLLRGTPDTVLEATVSEGLAQGPYVVARTGFKPATLRMKGPNLPMSHHAQPSHYH